MLYFVLFVQFAVISPEMLTTFLVIVIFMIGNTPSPSFGLSAEPAVRRPL